MNILGQNKRGVNVMSSKSDFIIIEPGHEISNNVAF